MQPQEGVFPVHAEDYPRIVEVWEASVRATHHFLTEADIQSFKPLVRDGLPHVTKLACVRDSDGQVAGFIGVVGRKVEMLFIHPAWRGQGIGRRLMMHAITMLGATMLDVNEQNEQAVGFYLRMGFEVVGRSALDSTGKPFPLLHMRIHQLQASESGGRVYSLYSTLHAELEATRQAFHSILATLTPADWSRPSLNPAWTIGEMLWHITGYLFMIPQQLAWLQTGTFPDQTQLSAEDLNHGNIHQTRAGAQSQSFGSIAQAYEEGHAATLVALQRVCDDEWQIGVRMPDMGPTFTGEYRTIEALFRYHARHFAEHVAQIPTGSSPT